MPPRAPSGRFYADPITACSAAGTGIQYEVGITRLSAEYLLHFARPYKHARHYLGFAEDLERRLAQHRAGRGARLVQVVLGAGIGFEVARTWDGDRRLERRLKNQRNAPARLCPICCVAPGRQPRAKGDTRRRASQRAPSRPTHTSGPPDERAARRHRPGGTRCN